MVKAVTGQTHFRFPNLQDFKISGFQVLTLDMGPGKVRDQPDAFSSFSDFQVQTIERRCTAPLDWFTAFTDDR